MSSLSLELPSWSTKAPRAGTLECSQPQALKQKTSKGRVARKKKTERGVDLDIVLVWTCKGRGECTKKKNKREHVDRTSHAVYQQRAS